MIKFDQVWSILDRSDSIWSKKIEDWKSDDIFQWLFHQKLKMWKKWEIWLKRSKNQKSILRAFARTRAKKQFMYWSNRVKDSIFSSQLYNLETIFVRHVPKLQLLNIDDGYWLKIGWGGFSIWPTFVVKHLHLSWCSFWWKIICLYLPLRKWHHF